MMKKQKRCRFERTYKASAKKVLRPVSVVDHDDWSCPRELS